MKRWVKVTLGLLAVLTLVIGSLIALVASQAGSRWLLGQVSGLEAVNFSGSLAGRFQAERLHWQGADQEVVLDNLVFDWSPSCLLTLTLCIDELRVEQVRLQSGPSAPSDDIPFSLPEFRLPLAIKLGVIEIQRLELNDQRLADIHVQLSGQGDVLQIDSIRLAYQDLRLQLSGTLHTAGGWLLDLAAALELPAPNGQSWNLQLTASGELAGDLQLQASSQGYLAAQLQGQLTPLAEHLPARLRLTSEAFSADPKLPPSLRLEQIELTAEGDLQDGYRLLGNARLPGTGGPVALGLDGRVKASGVQLKALELTAAADQYLRLAGELSWEQALQGQLNLMTEAFPWQWLYPLETPVTLERLQAQVQYADQAYRGDFASQFSGPAGAFELKSGLKGDHQQLSLPDLLLQAGQGKAQGQVQLAFGEALAWQAALEIKDLDPAYWLAELPGTLNGPLSTQGAMQGAQLNWQGAVDLQGTLRGQPTRVQAQALGVDSALQVPLLDLRLGDNRIHGQVEARQQLQGQLDIRLQRLAQLWPGLAGSVLGQLELAGSLKAPQGRLQANGQSLRLDQQRIADLQLLATLDAQQQATLELLAKGIRSGDTEIGQLTLNGSGDTLRQQAELDLSGPLLQAQLAADGRLEQGAWLGRLSRGRLQAAAQDWQLQQPASLTRRADGRLELGAHCWQSLAAAAPDASLCGENQRLLPDPSLRFKLQRFALASLQPWLPEDFAWDGMLNGELVLDLPVSGPKGHVRLDAGPGTLRLREQQQQWLDFEYQRLQLESRLTPSQIASTLDFASTELGQLNLSVNMDPRTEAKPLQGDFRLQGLDLSVARPFAPMVERLAGHLNGAGRLSGSLLAPRVDGHLQLSNGEISGGELPVEFQDLGLNLRIAGTQAQLQGQWHGGEQGRGQIRGTLDWTQTLAVDLQLSGQRLPVRVEPYAQLEADPDLRLQLSEQRLYLSGRIDVPRGAIQIRELPPSTVKLSEDARIVGEEQDEVAGLNVGMDIRVEIGQEKLTFSGFGLNAELAGQVHIGDNLDTRGTLSLNKGRYRAYGQRLNIRRARLFFAGPVDQPYLDVEAVRKVDEVIAGLRLSGSVQQPTTRIFSEPTMSQEQALSYLVLGRPLGGTGEESNVLGQAALALGLAGSSSITTGIANTLGIRDFELDTQGSGLTTSVVATGKISERLSLRYGLGVFEPANTFALRYELTRRLYLEAASGLASSLDIFYKRDF